MKMSKWYRIPTAVAFALSILAVAALLHGNPAATWVEAALVGSSLGFLAPRRAACSR